jgi:hypothetical protein
MAVASGVFIMLNVIMLGVILLNVVAPSRPLFFTLKGLTPQAKQPS